MSKYEMYGLEDIINECHSVAWEGCHKIYILMDTYQTELVNSYDYEYVVKMSESNPYDLFELVREWYEKSCYLKFIDVVYTESNGQSEFYPLVAQGENILEVM